MKGKFITGILTVAVLLGLLLVPAMGVSVSAGPGPGTATFLMPATVKVTPGSSFAVNVTISNPNGLTLSSGGIDVFWSAPSMLGVSAVDAGEWGTWLGAGWDNSTGELYAAGAGSIAHPNTTNVSILECVVHFVAGSSEGVATVNFNLETDNGSTSILDTLSDEVCNWTPGDMQNLTVYIGDIFNLTVTSNGCCNITVGGLGTVAANSSQSFTVPCPNVTLTANSPVCCNFVNWTVDGNSTTSNPVTVTGAANSTHNVTATCSRPKYNLTMAVTGNGNTTPSIGPHTYNCSDVVNINATADPGWWFVNWTTANMSEIANATAASTTVTVDKNKTVTANFVQRYNLTMAVTGNGTTTPAVGSHTYNNGTVVPINATPGSGWHFVNWTTTGNLSEIANATAASTNVTVDKNKTVTATFAINRYNLTINSTIGGNVTIPGEGNFTYDHGTVVNLTATPDADYAFVAWSGNVSTIGDVNSSNTNITMYGNYSIIASFGPHNMSASPTPLTFTTTEGKNPANKTLEVCNTGNGTLNWSLTDNAAWLSETPMNDTLAEGECEDVTVSVDVTGMAAGDYGATITITGSLELEVPVTLSIAAAGAGMPGTPGGLLAPPVTPAQLSASGLSISPHQVKPGQEVTISINVANTGGKTGSYNAVLYINGAVEDSQSVSVASGMTKNVIFTVSKSDAGVYNVLIAGQGGQFEVVHTGWFAGGLGTGGIVAIVVIVIVLIVALVFVLRGTRRAV